MRRTLGLTLLTASAILAQANATLARDASQLDLIRAAYADQAGSIDSFTVVMQVHGVSSDSGSGIEDSEFRETLSWAREGMHQKLLWESAYTEPQPVQRREWYSFDGRDRLFGQWDRETGKVLSVRIQRGLTKNFFWMLQPDDLLGRRLTQTRLSLADLLSQPTAQLLGREPVGDVDCWKVDLGVPAYEARPGNWHYFAWFDPSADFLPRRIRAEFVPDVAGTHRVKERWSEIRIEKFSRVPDPTRSERWFPAVATLETLRETDTRLMEQHTEITLTELKVNQPLSEEVFQLDMPPGTGMSDYRQPGMPKNYVVGAPAEIDRLMEQRKREVEHLAADSAAETLDASPRRFPLFRWFLGASLLCLTAAAVMRWRCARS